MLGSLAIIPDGNRRYAQKYGISFAEAYALGCDKAEEVFNWCLKKPKLKSCTIYGLSTENLARHEEQLNVLFALYENRLLELAESKKIHDNEVNIRIIGKPNGCNGLSEAIKKVQEATKNYSKRQLNIAIGYGGRTEIIDAVKKAAKEKKLDGLDEKNFSKYLYLQEEPDLLIRTSGAQRLSNFLPWQTAYSEIYFSKCLWPEFAKKDFNEALAFYDSTKRNFGK